MKKINTLLRHDFPSKTNVIPLPKINKPKSRQSEIIDYFSEILGISHDQAAIDINIL